MGGQLIKGYALEGDAQAPAGLTKAWKLYRGHKAQTHALASVFLIEKKHLKKPEKEESIRVAKKEASSLARVRHPGVLAVVEPLT